MATTGVTLKSAEIVAYAILQCTDTFDLQSSVNKHIKLGWVPRGGIAIGSGKVKYFQAMVKYE